MKADLKIVDHNVIQDSSGEKIESIMYQEFSGTIVYSFILTFNM